MRTSATCHTYIGLNILINKWHKSAERAKETGSAIEDTLKSKTNQLVNKMDNNTCSSEQEDAANRCRWFRINWKWCKMGSSGLGIDIRLNPMVSLVSAQIIWGFVA